MPMGWLSVCLFVRSFSSSHRQLYSSDFSAMNSSIGSTVAILFHLLQFDAMTADVLGTVLLCRLFNNFGV